jgi:hypothetical protein
MNSRLRSALAQLPIVAAVIVIAYLARRYAPWRDDFWTWANRGVPGFGGPLAIAATAVLIIFLLYSLWIRYSPRRRAKADDPMVVGCFQFISTLLAAALVLLLLAIAFKIPWATRLIAEAALLLAAIWGGSLLVEGVEAIFEKRR